MIKQLLFITAVACSTISLAQSLDLQDLGSGSIDGKTYYIYDSNTNLNETKFHVANNTSVGVDFNCKVYEIANNPASDWQVCFGTSCYVANDGVSAGQDFSYATVPASSSYNDLKVAPFAFGWSAGDWGVWRITVYDTLDVSDSSSAYIYWQFGGTPSGDINSNGIIDGSDIAGDVDMNGVIDGSEIAGDMNGNGVIDVWEVSGDSNGNGIIDNGEVLSIFDISSVDINYSLYPNPVSSMLTVNYSVDSDGANMTLDVYDIVGKNISTRNLLSTKGQLKIDVSKMNAGVYFYTIRANGKALKTERVIIN